VNIHAYGQPECDAVYRAIRERRDLAARLFENRWGAR